MNILLLNVFFAAMVYLEYKFANTYLNMRNECSYLNLIKDQSKSKFLFIRTTDCKIMYSSAVPVSILCSQANNLLEIQEILKQSNEENEDQEIGSDLPIKVQNQLQDESLGF